MPSVPGQSSLVRLACADDDAQGQSLDVFWDYELDRRILEEEGWQDLAAKGFDAPRQFAAFLHTLRWNCITATDPNLFQAPFRAGIKIDAYQMEPLRKALRLPRVSLFIADDTGLGKTIEAGLIARELLLRKKAKTIVVAAPPSVLEQWKAELEERFGLVFEILDRAYLTRMRRERGFGVNPWRTHSRFLVSHNLLIDPTYTDLMREWLGPMLPGSLLILDEAHHAAPASGGRYGIETKFTRAVRDLTGRFEHRLFLSATPHNGHSNSFSTLLELLDPYRFTRGVKVRGKKALEDVMVRRLKEDIREVQGGFPRRDRRTRGHRWPACRCTRARVVPAARRVPHGARGTLREHLAPSASLRGPARRRAPAAPALVHRGVRPQPQGPPGDRGEAVGEGAGGGWRRSQRQQPEKRSSSPRRPMPTTSAASGRPRSKKPRRPRPSRQSPRQQKPNRPEMPRQKRSGAESRRSSIRCRRSRRRRGTRRTPRSAGSSTGSARTSARTSRPSASHREARLRSGTTAGS